MMVPLLLPPPETPSGPAPVSLDLTVTLGGGGGGSKEDGCSHRVATTLFYGGEYIYWSE